MPSATPVLSEADVRDHVRRHVFDTGDSTDHPDQARSGVGIELEFLTSYREPGRRLDLAQAGALVGDLSPLPNGSRVTIEPGGQIELSGSPSARFRDAVNAMADDLYVLDQACQERRIDLIALGTDPMRPPHRIVTAPRYAAMERFFDQTWRAGRTMMCNTAALQLNLGLGPEEDQIDRWLRANRLGPVLIASFANSPLDHRGPTGWQSSRLRAWWMLDPSRSAPVALHGDPVERWIDYLLAARVMLVRVRADHFEPGPDGLTFGAWLTHGHELGWPDLDDLRYHLTTLFPPVRPRGWLELRIFDSLPTPFWAVAVAVAVALVSDATVADRLDDLLEPTTDLWIDAAQLGLAHPRLAEAATGALELAVESLDRSAHDAEAELVGRYLERWVARGRTPADDRLDAWRARGELVPASASPIPYGVPDHEALRP